MTERIFSYSDETGPSFTKWGDLLSENDYLSIGPYVIKSEVVQPRYIDVPVGHQVRGLHIFKEHTMTDGSIMNVLTESVVVKVSNESGRLQSMNIYVTSEEMPDMFLDIINFHRENGGAIINK